MRSARSPYGHVLHAPPGPFEGGAPGVASMPTNASAGGRGVFVHLCLQAPSRASMACARSAVHTFSTLSSKLTLSGLPAAL